MTDTRTRGHSWALTRHKKVCIHQRNINEYNRLPEDCVNVTSVKNKREIFEKIRVCLDVGYYVQQDTR